MSFETVIQSHQFLVHTYFNSYLPFFTISYIDAHPRAALADGYYIYIITPVLI